MSGRGSPSFGGECSRDRFKLHVYRESTDGTPEICPGYGRNAPEFIPGAGYNVPYRFFRFCSDFRTISMSEPLFDRSDVQFEASRSGGPGGQNVDKRATSVRVRLAVADLNLPESLRDAVREHLPPRHLTKGGDIIIENAEHRSQKKNRKEALNLLQEEIEQALKEHKRSEDEKAHKKRVRRRQRSGSSDGEDRHEKRKKKLRSEDTEELLEKAIEADPELRDQLTEVPSDNDDE